MSTSSITDRAQKCKSSRRSYPLPLPTKAQQFLLRRFAEAARRGRNDGWLTPQGHDAQRTQALFDKGYLEKRLTKTGVGFSEPYVHPEYSFIAEFRLDPRAPIREWVATLLEGVPAMMDNARS
jgi:hypothetical protein